MIGGQFLAKVNLYVNALQEIWEKSFCFVAGLLMLQKIRFSLNTCST